MERLVIFSGAGMSAESGLKTFRDSGGLWENYNVYEVATPEAWKANYKMVLKFYNERRKQILETKPNKAHYSCVDLEEKYQVNVITQNIDDLHERAGSKNVLHLHGEIIKSQSSIDSSLVYPIEGWELKQGDLCEKGSQLRPHVVWFGEPVPKMDDAILLMVRADIIIIIGTSLQVYPAAGLINYAKPNAKLYFVDPGNIDLSIEKDVTQIKEKAGVGLPRLSKMLLSK